MVLAVVALIGPFIHHFMKDRRALLGGLLPLLFMLLVAVVAATKYLAARARGAHEYDRPHKAVA